MCTLCLATGRSRDIPFVAGFSCNQTETTSSGTLSASKPVYSTDQIADQLTDGFWEYNFSSQRSFNVSVGGTISVDITALTSAAQNLARNALELWSDATGLRFSFTSGGAQIEFDDTYTNSAYSWSSVSGSNINYSYVNVGTGWVDDYGSSINTYSQQTYIHEIGHALGLGHAGNYNGSATYGTDNHYANDSWQESVMSYFSQYENTYIDASYVYAVSPQMADILAIRNLYGTAGTTRTGNTTYGDNANSGDIMQTISRMNSYISYTIVDDGGTDTLDFSGSSYDQVIDLRQEAISSVRGYTGNLIISRGTVIENAIGGSGDDVLVGNGAANTLVGGAGADLYLVQNTGDKVIEAAGGGYDHVISSVSFILRQHSQYLEELTLSGSSDTNAVGNGQNNIITGNSGNNVLNGAWGNDTLIGGDGDDTFRDDYGVETMTGGNGNDVYYVDNTGDKIIETAGGGYDHVISSISFILRQHSQYLEKLTLSGSSDIYAIGNGQNNTITGNSGNNVLNGAWGNDTLIGGDGNDIFRDDHGADTMTGGNGNDIYYVDNTGDKIIETDGGGYDHVISSISFILRQHSQYLEKLTLSGSSDLYAIGNGQNNTITGNSGNNVLNGAWGNDTLIGGDGNDIFRDDHGADTMTGGNGNDVYYVDNTGDKIIETDGGGYDHVISSVSFILRQHSQYLEKLTLSGSSDIYAIGNGQDNTITGNSGNNVLNGAWGNDTLIGGDGNDILRDDHGNDIFVGGQGADIFCFNNTFENDVIVDFEDNEDTIQIAASLASFETIEIAESGSDTVLTYADSSITLENFDYQLLSPDDFAFV